MQAAHRALQGLWRELAPAELGRLLLRLADLIAGAREELARLETSDMGKPISQARGDVDGVVATLVYNADGRQDRGCDDPARPRGGRLHPSRAARRDRISCPGTFARHGDARRRWPRAARGPEGRRAVALSALTLAGHLPGIRNYLQIKNVGIRL